MKGVDDGGKVRQWRLLDLEGAAMEGSGGCLGV